MNVALRPKRAFRLWFFVLEKRKKVSKHSLNKPVYFQYVYHCNSEEILKAEFGFLQLFRLTIYICLTLYNTVKVGRGTNHAGRQAGALKKKSTLSI